MGIVRLRDHSFVNALTASSVVLDCGSNYGNFAAGVTECYGCRCWALEPNPEAAGMILKSDKVTVLALALSSTSGTATFHIDSNVEASRLVGSTAQGGGGRDITVETLSLGDLMARLKLAHVDLAKFDIEGAEIDVFKSTPREVLSAVTQFTVEFHDYLPTTRPGDIPAALDRLRSFGFDIINFTGYGHGDLLAFNRRKLGLSGAQVTWLRHVTRNWRGLKQVLARKVKG